MIENLTLFDIAIVVNIVIGIIAHIIWCCCEKSYTRGGFIYNLALSFIPITNFIYILFWLIALFLGYLPSIRKWMKTPMKD